MSLKINGLHLVQIALILFILQKPFYNTSSYSWSSTFMQKINDTLDRFGSTSAEQFLGKGRLPFKSN